MFNINIPDIVKRNTAFYLRKPVVLAYTRVLLKPLKTIEGWFDTLVADIAREYRYNGLIHSLERMLNNTYDPIEERIYIETNTKLPIWFWKDESEQPDWFWKDEAEIPDWYWMDEDVFNAQANSHYEFTIWVHVEIVFNAAELLALVNLYRFAGYRARIVIYPGPEIEIDPEYYPDEIGG